MSSFLEEDAVSDEFAIGDKNTVKNKSTVVEDTIWSVLAKDIGTLADS